MQLFALPYESTIVVVLAFLLILTFIWALYLEMRIRKFMKGKDAKSLENIIATIQKENGQINTFKKEVVDTFKSFDNRISTSSRGISTVRFNAFGGRGESGAQSFATAIIDERGDGVIISSIHTRDNTRMYAKPLSEFESKHELSEEEKRALSEAKSKVKK